MPFSCVLTTTLRGILRDRVLYALLGVAGVMFLLVPVFSLFSMRQVQALAITLSLSAISATLLVLSVFLGATSLWRDIERRYTSAVLGLPLGRRSYVLGKFGGIAAFLLLCTLVLGLVALGVIPLVGVLAPQSGRLAWGTVVVAIFSEGLKYILLMAVALCFSALSTSFFLPVFGTLGVFFAGNISQEVIDFVRGDYGRQMAPVSRWLLEGLYYLLPNFTVFDLKVQAIYALPLQPAELVLRLAYFVIYTAILLTIASWSFSRRELT